MYKLYTDKQETFECDLFLEGADLKESSARIVVESNDLTLMFKGEIDDKGNCKVPIKKLKGLIRENTTGNIKLEVIAEDTLIEPWQSDFIVDTAKKVTVEVKSVKNYVNPINEMVNTLIENNITIDKVLQNKKKIAPILKNYADTINYQGGTQKFIKEVINKLAKN